MRTRDDPNALNFDAYFPDEAGLAYANPSKEGARVNKYTRILVMSAGRQVEITQTEAALRKLDPGDPTQLRLESGTFAAWLENPLDRSVNPSLRFPEDIPRNERGTEGERPYTAFAPAHLIQDVEELIRARRQCPVPVKVALYFGTGTDLGRHGLRSFVDKTRWQMIINVPGIEGKRRWGIGISQSQVAGLVRKCFGSDVPFVVARLLAFSTGYIGLTGTIRNRLVDLAHIEVLTYFDCKYGEDRVKEAIQTVKSATAKRVRVVEYISSAAGSPHAQVSRKSDPEVSPGGTIWLYQDRQSEAFQALTHARVLAWGLADKTVDQSEIPESIRPLITSLFETLPARGTVVSDPMLHQMLHGRRPLAGSRTLRDWYAANEREVKLFRRALWNKTGKSPELVRTIWKHKLPGWIGLPYAASDAELDTVPASQFAEGAHDFLPFEFAWEVLS